MLSQGHRQKYQAEMSDAALAGMEEHSISPVPLFPFQRNTEP